MAHGVPGAFAAAGLTGATVGVLALVSTINALSTSAYLPALRGRTGSDADAH